MPATVNQTTTCTHLGVRLIGFYFRRVPENESSGVRWLANYLGTFLVS